jgi:hypothetical protein
VVEVKATFNKTMAEKVTQKLLKLRQFQKAESGPPKYGETHLPFGFRAFAVFFETKVKNRVGYADALGALAPFWQTDPLLQFRGALIIRGQTCPEYSASTSYMMMHTDADFTEILPPDCEVSVPVPGFLADHQVVVVSAGYAHDMFWKYMIDMVHALNGNDYDLPGMGPTTLTGGYGRRSGTNRNVRLFPTP